MGTETVNAMTTIKEAAAFSMTSPPGYSSVVHTPLLLAGKLVRMTKAPRIVASIACPREKYRF